MDFTKHFWEGMVKVKDIKPTAYKEFVQAYQAASTMADLMIEKIIRFWNK